MLAVRRTGIQTQEASLRLLQLSKIFGVSLLSRVDCCLELQPNLVSALFSDGSYRSVRTQLLE